MKHIFQHICQASGGHEDKTVKIFKEEPLQRAAEVSESQSWNIGTDGQSPSYGSRDDLFCSKH